jgi:folate-binding protein YgfZ
MSSTGSSAALQTGALLGDVAARRPIGVAGPDRAAFLQGLLTNDIAALGPGSGCYAAWLTPQGRMLTDLHLLESGSMMLLDVPAAQHEATLARLDQFLFSEDVQVSDLSASLSAVWVHGTTAPMLLADLLGTSDLATWPQYRNERASCGSIPVVLARIDQLGVPGFVLWVGPGEEAAVRQRLRERGALDADAGVIEAARIEAGYPVFGLDMTDDTIPLEAGIEGRAISLTKGCYVGQEIIIRVLHRGHGRVARRLVVLQVEGAVPASGSRLCSGPRDAGWVTSGARSDASGPVALGYVQRDLAVAGSSLDVDIEGQRCVAVVRAVVGAPASRA